VRCRPERPEAAVGVDASEERREERRRVGGPAGRDIGARQRHDRPRRDSPKRPVAEASQDLSGLVVPYVVDDQERFVWLRGDRNRQLNTRRHRLERASGSDPHDATVVAVGDVQGAIRAACDTERLVEPCRSDHHALAHADRKAEHAVA
jgi:hypothetical protein